MMVSFIFLCPALVGAATVYLAERKRRRSRWYYIWASFTANVLFVLGAFIFLLEGLVCIIVIAPLFGAIGIFGGSIMGEICRHTNIAKRTLYGIAVLPLTLGGLEAHVPTPSRLDNVERSIFIRSAPETVWREIMNARDIGPDEMNSAWVFRIGVPPPKAGVLEQTPEGLVRKVTMAKDVHFDQVVTDWQENRYVHWRYRVYPDSFPPYALDDHVLVGGYYFDIPDNSYRLTPRDGGTELTIRMSYRVTTQFNWYTEPFAQLLLGNFGEVVLDFYRRRSERATTNQAMEVR